MEQKYRIKNKYGTLLWDVEKMLHDIFTFPQQKKVCM